MLDTSYLFPHAYFKKHFDHSLSQKPSLLSPKKRMVFTRSVFLWFSPLLPVLRGGPFHHRVHRRCVIFTHRRVAYTQLPSHLPLPCLLPVFCSKFLFYCFSAALFVFSCFVCVVWVPSGWIMFGSW
jgi:hypothetical protein